MLFPVSGVEVNPLIPPLVALVVSTLGTLPGLYFGAVIRTDWLPNPRHFKLFVGCVLLYIGLRLLYDQTPWAKRKKAKILEFEAQVQERLAQGLKETGT